MSNKLNVETTEYTVKDGVFYATKKKFKRLAVPDGVESIGIEAFFECAVEQLVLPDTLRSVSDKAFYCSHIKHIALPPSVDYIGCRAFDCSDIVTLSISNANVSLRSEIIDHSYDLTDIYFGGTLPQWHAVFDPEYQPYSACFNLHFAGGTTRYK